MSVSTEILETRLFAIRAQDATQNQQPLATSLRPPGAVTGSGSERHRCQRIDKMPQAARVASRRFLSQHHFFGLQGAILALQSATTPEHLIDLGGDVCGSTLVRMVCDQQPATTYVHLPSKSTGSSLLCASRTASLLGAMEDRFRICRACGRPERNPSASAFCVGGASARVIGASKPCMPLLKAPKPPKAGILKFTCRGAKHATQ